MAHALFSHSKSMYTLYRKDQKVPVLSGWKMQSLVFGAALTNMDTPEHL